MLVSVLLVVNERRRKHEAKLFRVVVLIQTRQDLSNIFVYIDRLEFPLIKVVYHDLWTAVLFAIKCEEVFENIKLSDHEVLVAKTSQEILPLVEWNPFTNLTIRQSCQFIVLVLICCNCDEKIPQVVDMDPDIFFSLNNLRRSKCVFA